MNTKFWGAPGWKFLHTIAFNYPYKIDHKNNDHIKLKARYQELFSNFQYTLPCKYCRESYTYFLKVLPMEEHMGNRKKFTYWFYSIHNEVNKKLLEQETDKFIDHRNKLYLERANGTIGYSQYNNKIAQLKKKLLYSEPKHISREYLKKEYQLFIKLQKKQITSVEYEYEKNIIKDAILFANASPSYESVCEYYEKQRASCGKKKGEIKSCRL